MEQWQKQWLGRFIPLFMALAGSVVAVSLFSRTTITWDAFSFDFTLELFDHGITQLTIPPLGNIAAHTHDTPLKLTVELKSVDLTLLQQMIDEGFAKQEFLAAAQQTIITSARSVVLRLLFLGGLGGAAGVLLLHSKKYRDYIRGIVAGVLVMSVLIYGTYNTFRAEEFLTPQYSGILEAAPWMVGMAEEALANFDTLGEEMRLVAENLYNLYARIENLKPAADPADLTLLHVSDIHNNPAAYDFIAQVAANFQVDAIVDTGDITDFGTPLETLLVERLADLRIPYLITPGNHDSPQVVASLAKMTNVIVMDGELKSVQGLKILGFADEASKSQDIGSLDNAGVQEESRRIASKIASLKETDQAPDLLMVHNHRLARSLTGQAPVIIFGHDHRLQIDEEKESVLIDAGTSGAAGVRGLTTSVEVPYSVVLLRFTLKDDQYHLLSADTIEVYNLKSGFALERVLFSNSAGETELAPPLGEDVPLDENSGRQKE